MLEDPGGLEDELESVSLTGEVSCCFNGNSREVVGVVNADVKQGW